MTLVSRLSDVVNIVYVFCLFLVSFSFGCFIEWGLPVK